MEKILKTSFSSISLIGWIKFVFWLCAMVVSLVLYIGSIQSAMASSLKQNILIEGENITVGDIFENAHLHSNYVLGPAPAPGEEMTLGASTLTRIARAFDIAWSPEHTHQSVTLRRSSHVIGQMDATRELVKSLKNAGAVGNFDVVLDTPNFYIPIPQDAPKTFKIEHVELDKSNKRFTASLIAPAEGLVLNRRNVSGRYYNITQIPVVSRRLRRGDIISKRDLDFITLKETDVQPDVLTNIEDVVGLTPRRAILAGVPMKDQDLILPRLIKRGDRVTIHLDNGPIKLTAMGKALETGAKNDLIRVVNLMSNRTIEATVTAEREVHVYTQ